MLLSCDYLFLQSPFLHHQIGQMMNNDSQSSPSSSSSSSSTSYDSAVGPTQPDLSPALPRHWRDVVWLVIFMVHLVVVGFVLGVFGLYSSKPLQLDKSMMGFLTNKENFTQDYWPLYAVAGGIGSVLGCTLLLFIGSSANQMMKFSVHILTTYLAVISVLCFWGKQSFWGITFAIGAGLQFLYVISVIDRLPFTMLVLQRAVKMVWNLPEVTRVAWSFMLVMLLWLALWSFGASGVLASPFIGFESWLLGVLSLSLIWTGAVLCNVVHVIVSGTVFLVLFHGGRDALSMPPKPVIRSVQYAVTTSFGSICYGSLFTAAIRTLRWEIRGLRSKIGKNECLLCCVDFVFHLVEFLVRSFNKYAYVQIAVYGKSFNHSAKDAWELFQSTGVETLIAYDCSGAVLFMGTLLGGLISGTSAAVFTRMKHADSSIAMVGSTAMLIGMIMVGLAVVIVESAVTSIYICYALDPSLISRWDSHFFNQVSEKLHQRLQHRSARSREVLSRRMDEAAFA